MRFSLCCFILCLTSCFTRRQVFLLICILHMYIYWTSFLYITTHLHCVYMHIIGCVYLNKYIYIHMCIYIFHIYTFMCVYMYVCVLAAAQLFRVLPSSCLLNTIGAAQAHQKQPWRSHSNAVSRHWAAKQHRTTCAAATPSAATPAPFARRHTK